VIPTSTTSTTAPPVCGNGTIEAGEQCDPKATSSPCVGHSPCGSDCQCPGKSCHDLPEAAVCDDLDDCTDDDVCHARICNGERKCRVELPEESPVESTKPKVNVTIDATPDARCKVKLFERVDVARLVSAASETGSDPLPGIQNGRRLFAKAGSGKIGPSGRLVVTVRLNKVAKKLFKNQPSIESVAEIGINEKAGKRWFLRQLITLVRP